MSKNPLISVCVGSNRPFLWKRLYDSLKACSNNINFEIIFVGPNESDFNLPSNVKYIKTNNIKYPQCFEIALKESQGSFFNISADDVCFFEKGLDYLHKEYKELCEKENNDNIIILPALRVKGRNQRLRYSKRKTTPFASLNSALINRKLLSLIKGVDKSFVGVYWDCDMAMRFQEKGIKIIQSSEVTSIEFTHKGCFSYLHRICKPYDNKILDSFWIRRYIENEKIPSEDTWCQMPNREYVLSRKRLKSFVGYKDENILLYSQGPKEIGDLKWE